MVALEECLAEALEMNRREAREAAALRPSRAMP